MSVDVKDEVRAAIVADMGIVALLGSYEDGPSVHTVTPAPEGAGYPMILISQETLNDLDAINSRRPVVEPQIAVYGEKPAHSRVVDEIGYTLRELFHRNNWSLDLSGRGLRIYEARVFGPRSAPTEDDSKIGRLIIPTLKLQET